MYPADKSLVRVSFRFAAVYSLPKWFKNGVTHKGVDLAPLSLLHDIKVNAPVEGRVLYAGLQDKADPDVGFGNHVIILRLDKSQYIAELHILGHLRLGSIEVKMGQDLEKGALVGIMGESGYATGVHLHYEVRKLKDRGTFVPINPLPYLT